LMSGFFSAIAKVPVYLLAIAPRWLALARPPVPQT
jgi:hypothetical protein